ncbi:MAG: rod-binding protein [Pseudomonadota bacterium]
MDLSPTLTPVSPKGQNPKLWTLAQKMESQFLAEMLKSAGLGETPEALGGGAGESQFSSFLVNEHADALVASGGIGLSEAIYNSLLRAEGSK